MTLVALIYVLNALWFAAGFCYFSLFPTAAAKLLVDRLGREAPLFRTLVASLRFLGGMNLALAAFAVGLLFAPRLFPEGRQNAFFCGVFALAHASQLYFNLHVLIRSRRDQPIWPVTRGPMLFIFAMDATMAVMNMAIIVLLQLA